MVFYFLTSDNVLKTTLLCFSLVSIALPVAFLLKKKFHNEFLKSSQKMFLTQTVLIVFGALFIIFEL